MEKTVLLSLCSLCFLAFTLTSDAKNDQQDQKEKVSITRTATITTAADTIPTDGTYRIHKKTDEQEINIEVENGNIKELEIDGKEIQPENYDDYEVIIDELFGSMDAPPSMQGFNFEMPPMPPMPEIEGLMTPMPPMAPMPPMGEMEFRHFYNDGNNIILGNGRNLKHKIWTDSLGQTRIIILGDDGDSSVIMTPGNGYRFFHGNMAPEELEQMKLKEKEWKLYSKDWEKHGKEWEEHGEKWQKMAEEWKKNWENNSQGWQDNWRMQEDKLRHLELELEENAHRLHGEGMKERFHMKEGQIYGLQDEHLAEELARGRVYGLRIPHMNMTDAMIEEGLIEPGEEAEIQLTPDKLKINGKKMDSETHKKYLRMYESQQGIELSGNSRVEFKTKTRRSM